MRYDNSLTASVQAHITQTLSQKIAEANSNIAIYNTAKEIREYLSDMSTINTPGFVLRRYIQTHHPELLADCADIADLTKSNNVAWSEAAVTMIAQKLAKISSERHGLNISSTIWKGYLSGAGARKRASVLKIALVLQMSVEDTLELLMAFDMEPYSARYPLDLICLFCQHQPGTYTWKDVEEMLHAFETQKARTSGTNAEPTKGMTRCILSELEAIFAQNLPQSNAKNALVTYMLEHPEEFKFFTSGTKETYLPGYSLGRLEYFLKLATYLSVLYPKYENSIAQETRPGENEHSDVNILDDGYPSLYGLTKAMFQSQNWKLLKNKRKNKTSQEDLQEDFDVSDDIYNTYISRQLEHVMAIDRLRANGKNVDFFERRDALIFAFFLINGYLQQLEYPDSESAKIMDTFNTMICDGDEFNQEIGDALSLLEGMEEDDRYACIGACLNTLLTALGYTPLYLPAPFDRFVLLSLLSTDPDGISPIILHAAYLEEYEFMI